MKNNKGFTLIEMLAAIVILITLIAIITPKIFSQLKTAEQVTDQEQINAIINIARIYVNQNSNILPEENDLHVISLTELKESGLIKKEEILNPSTKQELKGCIIVSFDSIKNKYDYNYKEDNCDKAVAVTFDPNGGTVEQKSKVVTIDEPYGTLPTPTREGYKFVGWNGKNMFNMTEWLNSFTTATRGTIEKGENSIKITATSNDAYTNSYGNTNLFKILVNPDSAYTLSWNSNNETKEAYVYIFINDQINNTHTFFGNDNYLKNKTFLTPDDALYTKIRVGANQTGDSITYSNIQLEEGNTATEYEPYYITSDTTVVQQNNHTLKAIWQANS